MPFVPNTAASEETPKRGRFVPNEQKSVMGAVKNLGTDVIDTAKGLGHLGQGIIEHPIDTTVSVGNNLIPGIIEEGKRLGVGELLTGHPAKAGEKFMDAAYNKPLTTAMSVLPAVGAAGKVMKGLRGAGAADAALAVADDAATAATKTIGADDLIKAVPDKVGKSASIEAAEQFAKNPPKIEPPASPFKTQNPLSKLPSAVADPLKEVNEFVATKYGAMAKKPGFVEKAAKYMKNEAADLRGKDIGLQSNQIRQMGEGFKGLEKAESLMDYAAEKGYFKPGLTDLGRKEAIKATMERAGSTVGAIRDIAGKRGIPPIDEMLAAVKNELVDKYRIKAPGEVRKVLAEIEAKVKKDPTFSGIADVATDLNKELRNVRSMGRHVGPNTDAADILSRMNNDAIRGLLNPEEAKLYTDSLRDFGAHKKLEKAVAGAGRRAMAARSNQRGVFGRLWQEALDRGGYRIAGNVADRTAKAILKDPTKVRTLPQFFEELVHQAEDVIDESIDLPGMAHGGIVGMEGLNDFLAAKYGKPKENQ